MKRQAMVAILLAFLGIAGCDASIQEPQGDGALGTWYDDLGDPTYTDATLKIFKENETYYLERKNGDGSSGKYNLSRNGNKFTKNNDKFGAYYIISGSNLKIYDSNGFIRDAKKIVSKEIEKAAIAPIEKNTENFISSRERKIMYSLLDYDKDCLENNNLKSELFICNAVNESILRSEESAIRASDIFNDYKKNEIAADLKYKGKHQHIVGVIAGVNKDAANNRIVSLKAKSFRRISAYIKSDIADERLAALKVGNKVYLGSCYGTGMVMGMPIFKDCSLIDDFFIKTNIMSSYNKFRNQCIDELENSFSSKRKVDDHCAQATLYYLFARDLAKQCPANSKNEACIQETSKTVAMLIGNKRSDSEIINNIVNEGYSYIKSKTGIDYRKQ